MDNSNKADFIELINSMANYYGKNDLPAPVLKMYFSGLEHYTLDQINHAAIVHMQNTKNGEFMPKVADFVRALEGSGLTSDGVIAAARLKQTPLGILCCIQIGTISLASGDSFHLRQRAEECLQLLPGWKARALNGDYTDHEISIMVKHDVSPVQAFAGGLPCPQNSVALISRVEAIKDTTRHKYLLERPYTGDNDKTATPSKAVSEYIAIEMMKGEEE